MIRALYSPSSLSSHILLYILICLIVLALAESLFPPLSTPHLFATALVPHQRVLLEFSFATGMMITWCTLNKE